MDRDGDIISWKSGKRRRISSLRYYRKNDEAFGRQCLSLNFPVAVVNTLNAESQKKIAEFSFENADIKSILYCKERIKSKLSLSSQCVETKLCRSCTSFTSHRHSSCGMVWYRTLRVKARSSVPRSGESHPQPRLRALWREVALTSSGILWRSEIKGSYRPWIALWVGHSIDLLPCHLCRKRRLRQDQLARRTKGLA